MRCNLDGAGDFHYFGSEPQIGQSGPGIVGKGEAFLAAWTEDLDDQDVSSAGSNEWMRKCIEQAADQHDADQYDAEGHVQQRRVRSGGK